jgi:hypothetical protein
MVKLLIQADYAEFNVFEERLEKFILAFCEGPREKWSIDLMPTFVYTHKL